MDYKTLIINEIKKLKNSNSITTPVILFEKACENLKYQILKYFREDTSMIFLISCQIILNGKFMINGKGKTKEEAYNNAIRTFSEDVQQKYFIDEINENIKNFDNCECLITYCKEFFDKETKKSQTYRNNLEFIKPGLRNLSTPLTITESYNITKDEILCSIYLNDEILLHQSCGKDRIEALENAAKEFFLSYSILSEPNSAQNEKEPEFILAEVLSQLRDHINKNNVCNNYFDIINKFVQSLNYKFEVTFFNGIATAKINGVKVAEVKEKDEYSSYILLCHHLINKIKQAKPYVSPPVERIQQSTLSNPVDSSVKPDKPQEIPVKNSLDLSKKYQKMAHAAKFERDSNETSSYWGIINRKFHEEKIPIEPEYKPDKGEYLCILKSKGSPFVESSGTSQILARENAARQFIKKYS